MKCEQLDYFNVKETQ